MTMKRMPKGGLASESTSKLSTFHFRQKSLWTRDYGGISAKKPLIETYFLGIVDILTQYDFKKKSENAFKRLLYSENDISAIPPGPYKERFVQV